jgi:hypothetical protein
LAAIWHRIGTARADLKIIFGRKPAGEASQYRSTAHRAGHRRREEDYHQGAARRTVGRRGPVRRIIGRAKPSDSTIELAAAVHFRRRGIETKLVLPGLTQQDYSARGNPALIKSIARGRAWFEELASGRARSLQELATRDGITRRYIRRLVGLTFLSPQLVEAILQGRQPVELTATRLTELDLPLDWAEQHKLLAS